MSKRLLVIDDDETILALFQAFLGRVGYTVKIATGGDAGIKVFSEGGVDAILCDLRMPGIGGLEVLRRVKELSPLTPFVIMSGTTDISQAVEALQRGAWDFLIKPFASIEVLPPILERLAERADLLRQQQQYQERLETEIRLRTAELTRQLEEKDQLLAEVHHRVKNNLQIILILLGLQQDHSSDPKVIEVLTESQNRLHTLALIQEEVHDPANTSRIETLGYFSNLVHHTLMVYGLTPRVQLTLDIAEMGIAPGAAFSYGLIVNELLTGIANHLPPGRKPVAIHFRFGKGDNGGLEISLAEDSRALAAWNPGPDSLYVGYALLKALVTQGGGVIVFSAESPDHIAIRFP